MNLNITEKLSDEETQTDEEIQEKLKQLRHEQSEEESEEESESEEEEESNEQKQKTFVCPYPSCTKKYCIASNLVSHIERVHIEKSESRKCKNCEKYFGTLHSLRIHKLTCGKKPVDKKFPCTIDTCKAMFTNKRSIKRHLRQVHGKDNYKYKCDVCGYKCDQKNTLNNHKMKHKDESDLPCDMCDARFKALSSLQSHMRTYH